MLIGNGALVHRQTCRQLGNGGASGDITAWMRTERYNRMVGGFSPVFGGTPSGARPNVAWVLPIKPGALSAYTTIYAEVDVSGTLIPARNIEAAITADVAVSGDLGLVVSALANITMSVDVTADIVGILDAAANITLTTNVTASLGALAGMTAALSAEANVSGNLTGIGSMTADIVSYGELTPEGLRDAVWNALAASYNTTGTMGAKLNAAGSAGDPWASTIEGTQTAGELLRIISAALAGEITIVDGAITITAAGDTGTTRIVAETDGTNRTNLTLTP